MRIVRPFLLASLLSLAPLGTASAQSSPQGAGEPSAPVPGEAPPPASTAPSAAPTVAPTSSAQPGAAAPTARASATVEPQSSGAPAAISSGAPAATSSGAPVRSGGLPPLATEDLVAGGLGLAGLVTGVVLTLVAGSIQGDIRASTPKDPRGNLLCGRRGEVDVLPEMSAQCEDLRAKANLGASLGQAGVGFIVTGGALVAAASAYWLLSGRPAKKSARTLTITPVVGAGGGLLVTGSF